jgi:hypothetical protein
MKAIEDYLVETTIGDIKDGRPIRMYYQGHGNAGKKKVYLMTNPIFSEPIDGEVECPCDIPNNRNFGAYYGAYMFSPNPVYQKVPIRFDKRDAIACDFYISINDNPDSDTLHTFNINAFGFGIHSDGITLCGSLHPTKVLKFFDGNMAAMHNMWANGITDPLTDDLDWDLYNHDHCVRNISVVSSLIKSAWNFLKRDKPIWKFDNSFIISAADHQSWKMVITMILNSEYTMLHQQLMDDYVALAEELFHRMEVYEKDVDLLAKKGLIVTTLTRKQYSYSYQPAFEFMLEFFDILGECNKLELLRQIPLDTRLKMIQSFNELGKHELVALLNHYHKGDYKSLDTMEGWEL